MSEELGRSPLGHYVFNCPGAGRRQHGNPDRARHRRSRRRASSSRSSRGEIRSCFTMTEPEFAGSNPVWLGTTARATATTGCIRGHKWFASSADGAAFAICMAVTDPDGRAPPPRQHDHRADRHARLRARSATSRSWAQRGGDWASHGEVSYQGARVPPPTCSGAEGDGFVIAQERLGPGPHPPLHALDRHLRARLRHPVPARGDARARARRAARHASRSCSSGSPRAAPRSTPRG